MEQETTTPEVPESPKPLAFTIDFGEGKSVATHRHKTLMDKFQKKHRRGQSLSKIDDVPAAGKSPRKSSFQSEGYFSSDEKDRTGAGISAKSARTKRDLTLQLKNTTMDRMTQSFPGGALPSITSPEIELKDVSSPELDLISPFSPLEATQPQIVNSSESEQANGGFVDGAEFDFDKSDTVSDAGTYTLDGDNYSEEQKARMSIDREFKIELVSVQKKAEEYVKSLPTVKEITQQAKQIDLKTKPLNRKLSPILSPTQNLSIHTPVDEVQDKSLPDTDSDTLNNTVTKIMFPSTRAKQEGLQLVLDQGSVISVTSSGAFRTKNEQKAQLQRKLSLTKSEVQVQAYIDGKKDTIIATELAKAASTPVGPTKLTANIVNVQSIEVKRQNAAVDDNTGVVSASLVFGKLVNSSGGPSNLPQSDKTSPSKIPSPLTTLARPRSRNSLALPADFSDTEIILKPTQNYINSLQQRLSLDSDPDSDYDAKYGMQLNNTAHLLKQRASHTRHNSLDDRTMNNKLEHFQTKNLLGIDQTFSNVFNQYSHKIQNSPNNSPIKRSSSFTTKNQINSGMKNTNLLQHKELNSPCLGRSRNSSIQRSSSTASMKPHYLINRRGSTTSDHPKIDRSQFGDTESSSEEDFDKTLTKRKDLSSITNTRTNRAFGLRRARLDDLPNCPNTPEIRRKYQTEVKVEQRAISVDRKGVKGGIEVSSRYMQGSTRRSVPTQQVKEQVKNVPKLSANSAMKTSAVTSKANTTFSRTDSGRFSMRAASKPPVSNATKNLTKKDPGGKKSGGPRSNSSLSSREVEFQNWKRRKSYDPMKAAAEGKKKEMMAKRLNQNVMTQSYTGSNHSQDSSPSHSSSVHRSQQNLFLFSFHGTAALEQLISSEEDDLTLSADEGFSPPTPSPCELSPARASLRHTLWDRMQR